MTRSVLIFLIAALVFARLIACGFVYWDDDETVALNRHLNPPGWGSLAFYWTTVDERQTGGLYVPVTYTVWASLAVLAKTNADGAGIALNPAVFHAANVLLHATAAALVFVLLRRLKFSPQISAVVAVLFAVHPVQVEAVGWVSGLKDLLGGCLSIAAVIAYVRGVQERRRRYLLIGAGLFVLGVWSKPNAIVAPVLAGVVDWLVLGRPARAVVGSVWAWFVIAVPLAVVVRLAQPAAFVAFVPYWQRPIVALDSVGFYLKQLCWPGHLCVDYGRTPASVFGSGAVFYSWVLPAIVVAGLVNRRDKILAAGALLFVAPLVPVSGIVPFEFQYHSTVADHYLYLPMVGVCLVVARLLQGWEDPPRRGGLLRGAAVLVLCGFAGRSFMQMGTWRDTRTLFENVLATNPNSVLAQEQLGYFSGVEALASTDPDLRAAGFAEAIRRYQIAVGLDPLADTARVNLARAFEAVNRYPEARATLHALVALQPQLPATRRAAPTRLARLLIDARDVPTARQVLMRSEIENHDPAADGMLKAMEGM